MTVGEMLGAFTAEVSLCKASIPPSLELGDNPPYLGITFFFKNPFLLFRTACLKCDKRQR